MRPRRVALLLCLGVLAWAGCAGLRIVEPPNRAWQPGRAVVPAPPDPGRVLVWLALSGGGTRAAALAYGVMEELERIAVRGEDGSDSNLLREVDYVSSVSGGSFAAAFYALNRDRADWKSDFKRRVLDADIETAIGARLIEPGTLFSVASTNYTRTNVAADYYDRHVFDGRRFRDLFGGSRKPVLILNASDLVAGRRFEFTPRDFNCLGSDLLDVRIADGVTASSAFPGAFPSLTLKNHGPHNQCPVVAASPRAAGACLSSQEQVADQFFQVSRRHDGGSEEDNLRDRLYYEAQKKLAYCNLDAARYIHLSDGGLTDNLGVDALLTRVYDEGSEIYRAIFQQRKVRAVVVIAVNAATAPPTDLGRKAESDWFGAIVLRGIDLMMERVAWDSLDAVRERVVEFERRVRQRDPDFRVHFLEVTFDDIQDPARRKLVNEIGTRLRLPPGEVDAVVAAGRDLVRSGRKGDNGRDLERIKALFDSLGR